MKTVAEASDPQARVGRNGKTYELGYKLHIAVDAKSELPLAVIVASANDNEKKHAPALLEKTLKATRDRVKLVVADSQYSSRNLRDLVSSQGVRVVIPFPTNQQRAQKGLLRVDKYFRTHGPIYEKRVYRLRSSIELINSRLKEQLCLEKHRVRGSKKDDHSCIDLRYRYVTQCSCRISVEQGGKSSVHNLTRKMSRN